MKASTFLLNFDYILTNQLLNRNVLPDCPCSLSVGERTDGEHCFRFFCCWLFPVTNSPVPYEIIPNLNLLRIVFLKSIHDI